MGWEAEINLSIGGCSANGRWHSKSRQQHIHAVEPRKRPGSELHPSEGSAPSKSNPERHERGKELFCPVERNRIDDIAFQLD